MQSSEQLVGHGMARGALSAYQPPCRAIASIERDGTAFVRSGATDIGPGPYTVMTMLAAEILGMPIERVRFGLGDSAMPKAPQEGGSGLTGALGNAVHAACVDLVRAFVNLVTDDGASPLEGCRLENITVRNGGIQMTDDPARFETYAEILTRHGLDELAIEAESTPPGETSLATMIARGGRFFPLRLHQRVPGAHAVHTPPTSSSSRRSGFRHGARRPSRVRPSMGAGFSTRRRPAVRSSGPSPMGIGMALLEETVSDRTRPSGDDVPGRLRCGGQCGRPRMSTCCSSEDPIP
jgi:CO/xanthine dehydrogenase Mo-binding subunit